MLKVWSTAQGTYAATSRATLTARGGPQRISERTTLPVVDAVEDGLYVLVWPDVVVCVQVCPTGRVLVGAEMDRIALECIDCSLEAPGWELGEAGSLIVGGNLTRLHHRLASILRNERDDKSA
jgi:hypothetical protein